METSAESFVKMFKPLNASSEVELMETIQSVALNANKQDSTLLRKWN